MANISPTFASSAGTKRLRDENEEYDVSDGPFGKRARPTLDLHPDGERWQADTPTDASQAYQPPKYDSEDQESMMSEPGSPQDMDISSEDDTFDIASYSQSPEDTIFTKPSLPSSSPWRERTQKHRVATPFGPTRPGTRPMQVRTSVKQHIRQRHPQQNSSDLLEVPSPVEDDECATPPSAAEAAGSQLSMLTVSDMDMEVTDDLPAITVDSGRGMHLDGTEDRVHSDSPGPDFEPMDSGPDVFVRKQRQRSGAQSNGSASPAARCTSNEYVGARRGFSMGFRADCEKCRAHVPGHMNHFLN